jgi:hypothetical protein
MEYQLNLLYLTQTRTLIIKQLPKIGRDLKDYICLFTPRFNPLSLFKKKLPTLLLSFKAKL